MPIVCEQCGLENPIVAEQCNRCMAPLKTPTPQPTPSTAKAEVIVCKVCGTENLADAVKCSKCDSDLRMLGQKVRRKLPSVTLTTPREDLPTEQQILLAVRDTQQEILVEQQRQTEYLKTLSSAARLFIWLAVLGLVLSIAMGLLRGCGF